MFQAQIMDSYSNPHRKNVSSVNSGIHVSGDAILGGRGQRQTYSRGPIPGLKQWYN